MARIRRRLRSFVMYVFWLIMSMCDSSTRSTLRDYNLMRKQLGISIPNRPAPASDPNASNAANFDESKVPPYNLPDPLLFRNRDKVETEQDWWKRRIEIAEDFEQEVYGRVPKNVPLVKWKILSEEDIEVGSQKARQKTIEGWVDTSANSNRQVKIKLLLAIPTMKDGRVPVVLKLGSIGRYFEKEDGGWKEQLLSKRWGYAILAPYSIQGDKGADIAKGIIGLVSEGKPRRPDDWGALRAWAWGASRAVDYFAVDPDVDANRIAVEGLSRYGKAALVAMAFDERFSLAFVGSTGVGGSKIIRRKFAEQVENVTIRDNYHWFCGNFIKYASVLTPDDLPVDAHELIALCAPRPVFISSGSQSGDLWADPKGMFLGGVHAGPVYELLGKKSLGTTEFPAQGTPLVAGEIAFRQHNGGHTNEPNWPTWISWASRYWEIK